MRTPSMHDGPPTEAKIERLDDVLGVWPLQGVCGVFVAFVGGLVVYSVINAISGVRLTEEEEFNGADLSIHRIDANATD